MDLRQCHKCKSPMAPVGRTTYNHVFSSLDFQCTNGDCAKAVQVPEKFTTAATTVVGAGMIAFALEPWMLPLGLLVIGGPLYRRWRNPRILSAGAAEAFLAGEAAVAAVAPQAKQADVPGWAKSALNMQADAARSAHAQPGASAAIARAKLKPQASSPADRNRPRARTVPHDSLKAAPRAKFGLRTA